MASQCRLTTDQKIAMLAEIKKRKDDLVLSGKFNAHRTADSIKAKWIEVFEFARVNGYPFANDQHDWRYVRDAVWPNIRNATKVCCHSNDFECCAEKGRRTQ
jgi:hypothetical protein